MGLRPANFHEKAACGGSVFRRIFAFLDELCFLRHRLVFSTLPSSSTVRRRQTTIVCATPPPELSRYFEDTALAIARPATTGNAAPAGLAGS
jgi:hypothetical protein